MLSLSSLAFKKTASQTKIWRWWSSFQFQNNYFDKGKMWDKKAF